MRNQELFEFFNFNIYLILNIYMESPQISIKEKNNSKIVWYYNSNEDPSKAEFWQVFSEKDNDIIEENYQNKNEILDLEENMINIENLFLINKKTDSIHTLKRLVQPIIRSERFNIPLPFPQTQDKPDEEMMIIKHPAILLDYTKYYSSNFIEEFQEVFGYNDNDDITENEDKLFRGNWYELWNLYNLEKFIDNLEKNIIKHSSIFNQEEKVKIMVDELRNLLKNREIEKIPYQIINIYTQNSFIYSEINDAFRNENLEKFKNIGFYAYFLNKILRNIPKVFHYSGVVFRGANFASEEIEQYKKIYKSDYPLFEWNGIISTTKQKSIAEKFGNALFKIEFLEDFGVDISNISDFKEEEEVLLFAGSKYKISNIQEISNKLEISLIKTDKNLFKPEKKIIEEKKETPITTVKYGRRIEKELKDIEKNYNNKSYSEIGIAFRRVKGDLSHYNAIIKGPNDSIYCNAVFILDIVLPQDYPFRPPKIKFKTKIWHVNISSTNGSIHCGILYDQWSPAVNIEKTLLTIKNMLGFIDVEWANEPLALTEYKNNKEAYKNHVKEWIKTYSLPEKEKIQNFVGMEIDIDEGISRLLEVEWEWDELMKIGGLK